MTPEEKENMTLSIENAMLKGFEKFAETMEGKIAKDIESHRQNCPVKAGNSFINTIKDWKTIAATILAIAYFLSSMAGKADVPTAEQTKQIVKQVLQLDPNTLKIQ